MASRASRPPARLGQLVQEAVVLDVPQECHHPRMRADHVRDVEERQPHLRRHVVGYGLRERVGRVLFAQPRHQLLVEPPGGLHRRHPYPVALRIEQDPPQLLDVRQDEIEQRRSGPRPDVAPQRGDGGLAITDEPDDEAGSVSIGVGAPPARTPPGLYDAARAVGGDELATRLFEARRQAELTSIRAELATAVSPAAPLTVRTIHLADALDGRGYLATAGEDGGLRLVLHACPFVDLAATQPARLCRRAAPDRRCPGSGHRARDEHRARRQGMLVPHPGPRHPVGPRDLDEQPDAPRSVERPAPRAGVFPPVDACANGGRPACDAPAGAAAGHGPTATSGPWPRR